MMTPSSESGDYKRDEVIAGEYVLGVLALEDRRKVEARMAIDTNFAAIVHRWEDNLSGFNDAYEDIAPPTRVFPAIEQRIYPPTAAEPLDVAASGGFWNSLLFWRSLAFASVLVAVGAGFVGSGLLTPRPSGKPIVAELTSKENAISLLARYDNRTGRLKVTPIAARQQEPKSLELWLIEGDEAPQSLGLLPQGGEGEIRVSPDMQAKFSAGAVLAVSLEPFGGAPNGVATGPIVVSGTARGF